MDQDLRAIDALRRDVATWRAIATEYARDAATWRVIAQVGFASGRAVTLERDAARRTMAERLGWVQELDDELLRD